MPFETGAAAEQGTLLVYVPSCRLWVTICYVVSDHAMVAVTTHGNFVSGVLYCQLQYASSQACMYFSYATYRILQPLRHSSAYVRLLYQTWQCSFACSRAVGLVLSWRLMCWCASQHSTALPFECRPT